MTVKVFIIDSNDNIATNVADEIPKGTEVDIDGTLIKALDDIPYGHKLAIRSIRSGDKVVKYGLTIGSAVEDIEPGNHVHVHNVESNRGRGDRYQSGQGAMR